MTIDPKVAAGGVAVVAIGGGAGVAIHQGTSSSSQEQTIKKSGIELAIENAGFSLETTRSSECENELKKELNDNNYKLAVTKCAQEKTFKARAEKLGLNTLKTEKITESNNTEGTKKGTNQQETIKSLKESNDSAINSLSDGEQKIKAFCDKDTNITTTTKTEDGHKFLKICVEEDEDGQYKHKKLATALTKDFGHNKETISSKMKTASFAEKTSSPCEAEKLLQPYEKGKSEEVISSCINSTTLKTRAEELKLATLPATDDANGGGSNGTTNKDKIKKAVGQSFTDSEEQGTNAKTKVQNFCTTQGETTISKTIANTIGHNYLTACTKDKTSPATNPNLAALLNKDFGTGATLTAAE